MHFFFYGTLLAGNANPVAQAIHRLLRAAGPASIVGALHAIHDEAGWFPALLAGEGQVHGQLYETLPGFDTAALGRMDSYEDFDPADPAGSLYLRETCLATAPSGETCNVQVYRFNQPLPQGSRRIPGGDFAAWVKLEQVPVFAATRSAQ